MEKKRLISIFRMNGAAKALAASVLGCTACIGASAQSRVTYGVEAALQASSSPAYKVGVNASIPLRGKLSFDPGLFLSMYNRHSFHNSTVNGSHTEEKAKIHGQFIQLPVRLAINGTAGRSNIYKVLLGPYFAYGIGGNTKIQTEKDGVTTTENFPSFFDSFSSRFDWGFDIEYQFYFRGHYQIGAYMQTGCKSIYAPRSKADEIFGDIFKVTKINLAFGLSLGYRF